MSQEDFQTMIKTDESDNIFVDKYDDKFLWLSIQVRRGGAQTVLNAKQVDELIEALQRIKQEINHVAIPKDATPAVQATQYANVPF